jgi:hypothetical protein
VVERDTGQVLDRLDRAGRAADVQRSVDERARRVVIGAPDAAARLWPRLAAWLVDEQVARDGQDRRVGVGRVEVDEQEVVGVRDLRVRLVTEEPFLPGPFLRAENQDVQGAVNGLAGQVTDLDLGDIAFQPPTAATRVSTDTTAARM